MKEEINSACFAKLPFRVRTSCFNTRSQEEVEEEAVLWANLTRNLANKALVCLHKHSIEVTDRCCNGIVREQ